ncbi:MAG: protease, partial [Acidobacteria bacterium]|nr:protease [Acidobacteriota bacterium]
MVRQEALSAALVAILFPPFLAGSPAEAQETRFLRQPTLSDRHVAFAHGADLWVVGRDGGLARRLTSTPAVESDPHFSPDGRQIAFSSNRSGVTAVYVVPVEGGTPKRLTWYPRAAWARGWSPSGDRVLYATDRETAPAGYSRLWTVSPDGGPSERVPAP